MPENEDERRVSSQQQLLADIVPALSHAYADILRRQGTASQAFVRWGKVTHRSRDFVWLGGSIAQESLMRGGTQIRIEASTPMFETVQRMHATAKLNPYEREILYGYPYLIGRRAGKVIRAPLLFMPVEIEPVGSAFNVKAADDNVRFNSLPFRGEEEDAIREAAVGRLIEATPSFPLGDAFLNGFVAEILREFPSVQELGNWTGDLVDAPEEPTTGESLALIEQAALFVAPKTGYFLVSDLETLAEAVPEAEAATVLQALLLGAGDGQGPEFDPDQLDHTPICYPFPSNRAQRRVALLVDDPSVSLVRVEGPPGTGKSLTLANLACHLAATGRTALITSQKDKALDVVDEMLRRLHRPELPMTLLRHDKASRRELRDRLEQAADRKRSRAEVESELRSLETGAGVASEDYRSASVQYVQALEAEATVEAAARKVQEARGPERIVRRVGLSAAKWRARRISRETSNSVAARASSLRGYRRKTALAQLAVGAEHRIAMATQRERQVLAELRALLRRDQNRYKNFPLFDSLKANSDWSETLLKLLPVWVLAPDDVARLFPAKSGLFDVVIVDEASQVDLPSITPVLMRAKKAVVFGDTRQMQPRRFSFVPREVALQAWRQYGMEDLDPLGWMNPKDQSLLNLVSIRAEEENLLDEHFRSLPPIIQFSNEEWYKGRLRIMTDERRKRFGTPDQPTIQLHAVPEGRVSNGSQENEVEAKAVVELLSNIVEAPEYNGASIGVIGLFEEQVAVLEDMILRAVDEKEWEEHDLVVVNPDGFQGDERDIILYSLSWDNDVMPRQALAARYQESPHVQGMLNVMITRARDEVHVFHSGPIETFTTAGGQPNALSEWLAHCAAVQRRPRPRGTGHRVGRVDSEFEAEVASRLEERGVRVMHQYPCAGFRIDLMCEYEGRRLAVECDGETFHLDEHGDLRTEDLERQAVIERAGWRVDRIPYRRWLKNATAEIDRILSALLADPDDGTQGQTPRTQDAVAKRGRRQTISITRSQEILIQALRDGNTLLENLLIAARRTQGHRRLGRLIRQELMTELSGLNHLGLVVLEEGEVFLSPLGREAGFQVRTNRGKSKPVRRTEPRRRRASGLEPASDGCACGGSWVRRRGPYGDFYGCSRFPRCRRTKSILR